MRAWSEIEFEYDSQTYGPLLVSFATVSCGPYDEPSLEQDGDLLIEKVLTPDVPALVCISEARVERGDEIPGYPGQYYPDTHYSARYGRNPAYRSHEIPLADFPESEQREIEARVERLLDEMLESYGGEISQCIAESAADALYDMWKDRES